MAPAVPFALLGVVQMVSVAVWLGLAGAVSFPRLRRRVTPFVVVGALAMATADAITAARYGVPASDGVAWLRAAGLALVAVGLTRGCGQSLVVPAAAVGTGEGAAGLGAVVVPLGASAAPSLIAGAAGLLGAVGTLLRGLRPGADRTLGALLAGGLLFSGVAAALAEPARDSRRAALAVLAARGAASLALAVALVLLARLMLVGKIVGAIVAGVVAMAVAAVGVVGTGIASEVQREQSQRLLQVAQGQQATLSALSTRAALFARVVGQCPIQRSQCVTFLRIFAEQPDYFGVIVVRGKVPVTVAPSRNALSQSALVQIAGSAVVRQALQRDATVDTAPVDTILLGGSPPKLALVAAVPGRPGLSNDSRVRPTFAAVYGIGVVDAYLRSAQGHPGGYDVSVIADGQVVASSLTGRGRDAVLAEAAAAGVERANPSVEKVVPAESDSPTVAFVPITAAGNGDVRVATLAVSQPANEALSAQRAVLRRLFLTSLIALVLVALLAIALAQRIADPVRRLTFAAGQVRRGDLDTTTTVASKDEVGRLSRAFDAMTASLRGLTADLRETAAEEAAVRARLETVVSSMSDGLVVTDTEWRVTSANPTAVRLLGLAGEDEAVGRKVAELLTVEDAEGRPLVRGALTRTVEGDLVGASGSRVPVRIDVAALADGSGRVVVVADRTREHEVERMKTEFLSNISHELRTPLTPIRGYAELLMRRPELERAQVETFLEEILNSTGRMGRAVELLVDVAALESGRIVPQHNRVTVRSFVDERVETWKGRYPERAGDFKRRVATKLPPLDIDRHWVSRALDEFADNAVKYTAPGTAITVVAGVDDDPARVRVAVKDTGPGFDPARAAELVGDFSQEDASDTRRVGGLGLGLGFVNRVADRFDLRLTVATTPGQGSEFALGLPAVNGVGS